MLTLIVFSLVIIIYALSLAFRKVRTFDAHPIGVPATLQRLCDFTGTGGLTMLGIAILLLAFPDQTIIPSHLATTCTLLLWIARGLFGWLRQQAIMTSRPQNTLRTLLWDLFKTRLRNISKFAKTIWEIVGPKNTGWNEISIRVSHTTRLSMFNTILLIYSIGIIAPLILLIPSSLVILGYTEGVMGTVLRTVIGYNALFIVSIVTLPTLMTSLLSSALHYIGVIRFPINLKQCLTRLAIYVGYGTLAGVIAVALSPLTTVIFKVSDFPPLIPSTLIDLPAIGAIGGYIIGLMALIFSLGNGSSNLVYRYLLFPALFLSFFYAMGRLGLTPEFLFEKIVINEANLPEVSQELCDAVEHDEGLRDLLSSPPQGLALAKQCAGQVILSGSWLFRIVSGTLFIFTIINFGRGAKEAWPTKA